MDEQALYRAILAEPHDDTPRLVYADWIEEHADRFRAVAARAERARAEFIRVQCASARSGPGGWLPPLSAETIPPAALVHRQRRLHFHFGRKWRRTYPDWIASQPFDRGFLRPRRSFRPHEFLAARNTELGDTRVFSPLRPDHPARRYLVDGDLFSLCPLWDIHLYASDYHNDPWADFGHYAGMLEQVGASPALARVGWLQVTFFRTPTAEFLRTGTFPNVETLILNCGPFPEVLDAVAENESFRSLRYVWFGPDRWWWAGAQPAMRRYVAIIPQLEEANRRHLPHGEMRLALRSMLAGLPTYTVPPVPQLPPPTHTVAVPTVESGLESALRFLAWCMGFACFVGVFIVLNATREPMPPPAIKVPAMKVPNWRTLTPEEYRLMEPGLRLWGIEPPQFFKDRLNAPRLPVAPPPRPVPEKPE